MFATVAASRAMASSKVMLSAKTMLPKAAGGSFSAVQSKSFFKWGSSNKSFSSATSMSDKEVNEIFNLWNDALATLDPDTVAKRYAKETILLPTVSDEPRKDYDSIKAYFVDFLKKKPQGVLLDSKVIKGENYALDAGVYEFTMGATGDKVKARYTYLYTFEDGEWKIAHQ